MRTESAAAQRKALTKQRRGLDYREASTPEWRLGVVAAWPVPAHHGSNNTGPRNIP
jgi:hypothetical protein